MNPASMLARAGVTVSTALVVALAAASAQAITVGEKAPAFTLISLKGRPLLVDPKIDKRSKLLIFWASW